jgi:hypothetical protein
MNNEYAVEKLPEMLKRAVIAAILDQKPLREIGKIGGISHEAVRRYRDDVLMPSVTGNSYTAKELAPVSANSVTKPDEQLVRTRVDALWKRTETALTRVESRADADFSGREWAAVATVAHRNAELMGRMTGELQDKSSAGDVNIQILMPAHSREPESLTIDVDVVKGVNANEKP